MKRHPHSQPRVEEVLELPGANPIFNRERWPKWLTTEQAATYLGKFRRKDGLPSVGAIRNMIYRNQIAARKFFGRILISRTDLDHLIVLSPQLGGG